MGNKSECAAEHLLPLRFHVLKEVILAAHNGQGDWEGVQQVTVWMVTAKSVPCPLSQPLYKVWPGGLEVC